MRAGHHATCNRAYVTTMRQRQEPVIGQDTQQAAARSALPYCCGRFIASSLHQRVALMFSLAAIEGAGKANTRDGSLNCNSLSKASGPSPALVRRI